MTALRELAGAYGTCAIDLWRVGESARLQSRHALSDYVRLLRAFMAELHIVACSPDRCPSGPYAVGAAMSAVRQMAIPRVCQFKVPEKGIICTRLLRDLLSMDVFVPGTPHSLDLKGEWRRKIC